MSKLVSFDLSPVLNACDRISQLDYSNDWLWGKPVKHGEKSVHIRIVHDVDIAEIYMIIRNKNAQIIKQEKIYSLPPHDYIFMDYLGPVKWVSDREIALVGENGSIFTLTIDDNPGG